jgi:hypothetical protein
MKGRFGTHFKYAFLSGLYFRAPVFAVILIMNTVFIVLGSLGLLSFAAHVTAVSLGGVAIAVMLAANIGGDVAIARRMFSAPEAYLYALTPAPRWKILLASVTSMALMDIATLAFAIATQAWLSLNLAGVTHIVQEAIRTYASGQLYWLWFIPVMIAGYFLMIMLILFCVTAKKSIFYKKAASGFLSVLLAIACLYAISLLQIVLAPFGTVQAYGLLIMISLSSNIALPLIFILTLLEAAALFILTSKLLERKINI